MLVLLMLLSLMPAVEAEDGRRCLPGTEAAFGKRLVALFLARSAEFAGLWGFLKARLWAGCLHDEVKTANVV